MSANIYTLVGAFLTSNPEERLAGDTPLVEFTVVDNAWNEKRYLPKFVTVSCGGRLAEVAKQLRRGDSVTVSGRQDVRMYEGKDKKIRLAFSIDRPSTLTPHVNLKERAAEGGAPQEQESPAEAAPAASRFD